MSEKTLVVIPALNAERSIGAVVRDCKTLQWGAAGLGGALQSTAEAAGATLVIDEVLVVDDGSADRTAGIARSWSSDRQPSSESRQRRGAQDGVRLRGGARLRCRDHARRGWSASSARDPKFLAARAETGADLIIGGRAHLFGEMLPRRRFANRFSAWSIAFASKTNVTDSQSGFRLYSAHLLRAVRLRSDGFDLESEVIVYAGCRGFKVITIPIDLGFVDGQSTSHYKPLADSLRIAWTVARARWFWR